MIFVEWTLIAFVDNLVVTGVVKWGTLGFAWRNDVNWFLVMILL